MLHRNRQVADEQLYVVINRQLKKASGAVVLRPRVSGFDVLGLMWCLGLQKIDCHRCHDCDTRANRLVRIGGKEGRVQ